MTINVNDAYLKQIANGATNTFNYDFFVAKQSDLLVFLDETPTATTAITGLGNSGGGTFTVSGNPPAGVEVVAARGLDIERKTNFTTNGDLTAALINKEFNYIRELIAQSEVRSNRGISFSDQTDLATIDTESTGVAAKRSPRISDDGTKITWEELAKQSDVDDINRIIAAEADGVVTGASFDGNTLTLTRSLGLDDIVVSLGDPDEPLDRTNPATLAVALDDTRLQINDALHLKEHSTGTEGGAIWDVFDENTFPVGAEIFDVFDHDTLPLQLKLRNKNGIANLQEWGCAGDGVVTAGVASGTDDVLIINAALESRLKVIGDPARLYFITATRVRKDGSNKMEDVHLLAADNLETGLELGWRSGDNTASSTLTGADLTISTDRVVQVVSSAGMSKGELITLKSNKIWPFDIPRGTVYGETNVIDSISGNFLTLVMPLSNTFLLGSETVTVATYPCIKQELRNVSVEYGEPIDQAGVSIQFSQNPILIDVMAKNCASVGLNLSSCWMAAIARPIFIDCWLTGGATGYGMQENNCAWSTVGGLKGRGNRRAYDASGTYPTRYTLVDGFQVTGEITSTSGSGVGTHSAAQFITFSNGKVDGADIGIQIRAPDCVIDNCDLLLNTFPITLGFTLALTVINCRERPKEVASEGSFAGFPSRFIDISNLPDDLPSTEKLVVQNNRATTRLDFIKINGSLNDGIKHIVIEGNYSNLLTNTSANTINFLNAGASAALSESVVLGNTFETNGHTGTKHFYNPNITISDAAPNALQKVPLGTSNLVSISGTGTLAVDAVDLRWETDGEFARVFGEVQFTITGTGTLTMKITGMPQKQDLNDLGVQVGGLFDGVWSDLLVTKNNRQDIFLGFEGFRTSRVILEPFPLGVHVIPIDISYKMRFPMN